MGTVNFYAVKVRVISGIAAHCGMDTEISLGGKKGLCRRGHSWTDLMDN